MSSRIRTLHPLRLPRAAALALLRFADYLELIQRAGVETTDDLCAAIYEELRAVCRRGR